jgi:integrase
MGSITEVRKTKTDKTTGKVSSVTTYRAFIRRTVGGKSVSKSKVFATRGKAKEWLRNNENDEALAALGKVSGPTFADLIESFVKAPPKRGTKFWSASHLEFWREQFGQMKTGAISRGDINSAVSILQNKPALRVSAGRVKETNETITPATVNRYLASLSSVLNFALDQEIIEVHPLKAGRVRKLKESKGRRRILTAEEEQRLYYAAAGSSWPMMGLFLRVCLTTAARKSEVLKLRWKDIHLDESIAILPTSKNDEPRALPLLADVKAALVEAQKVRPLASDFVFFDPRHPERPKNIDTVWKFVRERAGLWKDREDALDRVVLHTTRHTVATKLLKKGANIAQTANITGHKTLAMLKRYTHLAAQDAVDLAERMLSDAAGDIPPNQKEAG